MSFTERRREKALLRANGRKKSSAWIVSAIALTWLTTACKEEQAPEPIYQAIPVVGLPLMTGGAIHGPWWWTPNLTAFGLLGPGALLTTLGLWCAGTWAGARWTRARRNKA